MVSGFRSLNLQYEQEEALQAAQGRPWPATYRESLPNNLPANPTLQIGLANQPAKVVGFRQLATLPFTQESRRIVSKAGWAYDGHWKSLSFQTVLSLLSASPPFPSIAVESWTNQQYVLPGDILANYHILLEENHQPLSTLYGGPIWIVDFNRYIEYGIPHVKSITVLANTASEEHPMQPLGFDLENAKIQPGSYYSINQDTLLQLS